MKCHLTDKGAFLLFTVTGVFSETENFSVIKNIIAECRLHNKFSVFVDMRSVDLSSLTFTNRVNIAKALSEINERKIRWATVVKAEFISPGGITQLMAENRGANYHTFSDENEALKWLIA